MYQQESVCFRGILGVFQAKIAHIKRILLVLLWTLSGVYAGSKISVLFNDSMYIQTFLYGISLGTLIDKVTAYLDLSSMIMTYDSCLAQNNNINENHSLEYWANKYCYTLQILVQEYNKSCLL